MPIHNKKTKRELMRIGSPIRSWVMNMYEPYLRWRHARTKSKSLNLSANTAHVFTGKVAVYLVYQPAGLLPSTWLTLEHLKRKGYSTLLVSNTGLLPDDIARVMPLCWQIMQRPNFGYDFGGYQDGILHVIEGKHSIAQMIVLNDSIWFPLCRNCDFLDRMESSASGFVGAFQLEPTRDITKMKGKKRPFMGSFFWHFKQPVLASHAFFSFWRNYKATSSKYATIRRGERRFTHHMQDEGINGEAMYSRLLFDRWLKNCHGYDVRKTLHELNTTDPTLSARKESLLKNYQPNTDWEVQAKDLAWLITASQNIMATAPIFMVRDLGLPFIKKSTDETNLQALKHLLAFFSENPDLIDDVVINEIRLVLDRHYKV